MDKELLTKGTPVLYQNRYCDQQHFDLIISGNHNKSEKSFRGNLNSTLCPEFTSVSTLVINSNMNYNLLTSCSSIWIIRTEERKNRDPCTMASGSYDVINNIVELPDYRSYYCVCSFMKNLFVFGGMGYRNIDILSTCIKYSCKTSKWSYIASLKTRRFAAACTVFEGRIVVCGGYNTCGLKSVESYDHHVNKWTNLPNMIESRNGHAAVSVGNKMYVICGQFDVTCEVFDSVSRKFNYIRQIVRSETHSTIMSAVSIGYKIIAFPFQNYNSSVDRKYLIYDVFTDKWEQKLIELVSTYFVDSCSKLPTF